MKENIVHKCLMYRIELLYHLAVPEENRFVTAVQTTTKQISMYIDTVWSAFIIICCILRTFDFLCAFVSYILASLCS